MARMKDAAAGDSPTAVWLLKLAGICSAVSGWCCAIAAWFTAVAVWCWLLTGWPILPLGVLVRAASSISALTMALFTGLLWVFGCSVMSSHGCAVAAVGYAVIWVACITAGTDLLPSVNIHFAVVLQMLVALFASKNAEDRFGKTALHRAAEQGQLAAVCILLAGGADKKAKDNQFGMTPLHVAAQNGSTAAVHALLAAGADKDAKDLHNCTPLHWACGQQHAETAMALISASASLTGQYTGDMLRCIARLYMQGRERLAAERHAMQHPIQGAVVELAGSLQQWHHWG